MVNIKRDNGQTEKVKTVSPSVAINRNKVEKVEPDLSPIRKVANTVGAVAGGVVGSLAGAYAGGGALKKAGSALYKANLPPTADDARALQAFNAGIRKTKPRLATDVALDLPMVQKGGNTLGSKLGGYGTRSMIGDQTQAAATNMFKDKIVPIFRKADTQKVSFQFKDLLNKSIESIKNNKLYAVEDKKQIIDDITKLFDDFKGKTGLENLDKLKRTVANKVPAKYYKTGVGQIPYSLHEARKTVASVFRNTVHDTIKSKFGVDSAKIYSDYASLKGLSEVGVKAKTQAGRKGGAGTFISWLSDTLATPATTTAGKATYKVGDTIQKIPKALYNRVKPLFNKTNLKNFVSGVLKDIPVFTVAEGAGQGLADYRGLEYDMLQKNLNEAITQLEQGEKPSNRMVRNYLGDKSGDAAIKSLRDVLEEMGDRPEKIKSALDLIIEQF